MIELKSKMTAMTSDKWSKPNEFWYQKTSYTDAGRPDITYHFKIQLEPPAKVFEIETHLTKQLCGYELLKKDLKDILNFYKDLEYLLSSEVLRGRTSLQKSIVRSIVVTYAKCFAQADGRKIKLNIQIVPQEYIELHQYLIKMRDAYVAHAGESGHESCKYVLVMPPEKSLEYAKDVQFSTFTEIHQAVNVEIIFKENFEDLIEKLLVFVNKKTSFLDNEVVLELKKYIKDGFLDLYNFERQNIRSTIQF